MNLQAVVGMGIVVVAGFAGGVSLVEYLTCHPLRMSRWLAATMVAAFVALAALVALLGGWVTLLGVALGLAAALLGYSWRARAVLGREDDRYVPPLTRARDDPGLGHTAVVYFTHGEPESYDPIGWLNQFREMKELGTPFVPFLAQPFFLFALRQKYLRVGRSDHRRMHQQMVRKLEDRFRARGDQSTRFYVSFLDDEPRPDAAAVAALNEGASRIVVAEVFLTVSNHTAEGEEMIEALDAEETCGVPVRFTAPLWDSPTLKQMFIERASRSLGGLAPQDVGILLVGHGQPDHWDTMWPSMTEHETRFRQELMELFVQAGYRRENVGLAWMEFKSPRPAEQIERFVQNGARRVLYFSAAISADAIHSQFDVPDLVAKARVPAEIALVNMGAWNDDPIVLTAIEERIVAAMAGEQPDGVAAEAAAQAETAWPQLVPA